MIKIEAIIRPERINEVTNSLVEVGCAWFHYQNVTGQGQQQGVEVFTGRGSATTNRVSLPKVMITTVIENSNKKSVIEAIINAAKTSELGEIGDGKIFVSEVSDVIRVRTGDTGTKAL